MRKLKVVTTPIRFIAFVLLAVIISMISVGILVINVLIGEVPAYVLHDALNMIGSLWEWVLPGE